LVWPGLVVEETNIKVQVSDAAQDHWFGCRLDDSWPRLSLRRGARLSERPHECFCVSNGDHGSPKPISLQGLPFETRTVVHGWLYKPSSCRCARSGGRTSLERNYDEDQIPCLDGLFRCRVRRPHGRNGQRQSC
jgi:hypothetical protein